MIKKIASIRNLAIFTDFQWDRSVVDPDGCPIDLKQLNIIYGRNYSGKTTLSRIVRSLHTGEISPRYGQPEYSLLLGDDTTVTQDNPKDHSLQIRVFNDDFVRDNLQVFDNDDESIAAFAILGEDNAEIAAKLAKMEEELGSEDKAGSLRKELAEQDRALSNIHDKHRTLNNELTDLLKNKAREIKENSRYADVNYTIRKIRPDIQVVSSNSYTGLSDEGIITHEATLSETEKPEIASYPVITLKWEELYSQSMTLLEEVVVPTAPINDLLADSELQRWVDEGRSHHRDKRDTCAFCASRLPDDLWDRLEGHFSKEANDLEIQLESLLEEIAKELTDTNSLLTVNTNAFYSAFSDTVDTLVTDIEKWRTNYATSLNRLREAMVARYADVFASVAVPDVDDVTSDAQRLWDRAEELRKVNNEYTASLAAKKTDARNVLRRNEVSRFIRNINYAERKGHIAKLEEDAKVRQRLCDDAKDKVRKVQEATAALKAQMHDERKGAEKVNEYLSQYFGHPSLRLKVLSGEGDGDDSAQYRFEIQRDNTRAYHLSEGEKGLLSFCYFMGRLEDTDTTGKKPVIWIDDPISSLDENHVFFIYSLIQSHILERDVASQLVVTTHSLAFLKYLRRLNSPGGLQRSYFVVERSGDASTLKPMPKHLKLFSTEFHYLFDCLYRCAKADPYADGTVDVFYSFGNNVRKFLEMYLYFRFPNAVDEQDRNTHGPRRIDRFLGNDRVSAALVERIENEYSHLHGLFERGATPVDIPAMQKMAQLILHKIKEHDTDQYEALLQSIGVSPEEDAAAGDT